jgi:hypothetical protein
MGSGSAHSRFLQQPRDLIFRLPKSLTAEEIYLHGPRRLSRGSGIIGVGRKRNVPLHWGWNHGSSGEGVFLDYPDKRPLRGP